MENLSNKKRVILFVKKPVMTKQEQEFYKNLKYITREHSKEDYGVY